MRKLISFSSILTSGVLLFLLWIKAGTSPMMPLPQDGNPDERDPLRKQKREAWIKRMHRAAPGVDVAYIEEQNRFQRYQMVRAKNARFKAAANDTLAEGQLIGEWKERGSANVAGRIHLAEMDTINQTLYAATAGGNVWKGNVNGTGWHCLNELYQFDNIIALRLLPLGGGTQRLIACAGGSRVHYTDDDGLNWNLSAGISNIASWGYIKRMVVANDAANTIFLLAKEWDYTNWLATASIYKSTDKGLNFSKIISYPESNYPDTWHMDLWTERFGGPDVFFLREDSVFTLHPTTGIPQGRGKISLLSTGAALLSGWDSTGTTWLYAYEEEELYRSTDAGQNWTHVSTPGYGPFSQNSFSVSIKNKNRIYVGDVECNFSNDGGLTWQKKNDWWTYYGNIATQLHADIPSILPMMGNNGVEWTGIGTDGGLYYSDDDLQNVHNLSLTGLHTSQYYSVFTSRNQPHRVYAGAQDQGWQRATSDPPSGLLNFSQVISGDYGHIVSSDGGQSIWMNYPGFSTYYPNAAGSNFSYDWQFSAAVNIPLWIPPLMADPAQPSIAYLVGGHLGGGGSRIIKLQVSGGSIQASEGSTDFKNLSGGGVLTALNHSPVNVQHWYALTENGKFFKSTDAGQNWNSDTTFSGPGNHYFYGSAICSDPLDESFIYLGGSGYSNPAFFRSDDGGMTFYSDTLGLGKTLIYDLAASREGKFVFASTESGPFVYVKADHRWYFMGAGSAPDQTYWSVDYFHDAMMQRSFVRFGTYGRGIWDFSYSDADPVAFEEKQNEIRLEAFPNPAKDKIHLRGDERFSSVKLFGMNGALLLEQSFPHDKEMNLDGLPSGMYLLEASGPEMKKVKKIILQ